MRKLLIPLYIIFLFSCNSNETKDSKATDSTSIKTTDTGKTLIDTIAKHPPVAVINIKDFEVPEKEALEMIKWMKGCKPSERHDGSAMIEDTAVINAIKNANPGCTYTWVNARYKDKDDEAIYCRTNGNDTTGGRCAVKNYKTKLLRVTCAKADPYYSVIRLCPPPIGCDRVN